MSNTNKKQESESVGYWLGLGAKIILGVAMLVYLGLHSYNFFSFTFKGDQWIFAPLGLFTTSIGFLLWLVIYLYVAEDGLAKAIAIFMMFVSLGGEFVVAAFDMYMNISGQLSQVSWTAEDLRNMSYVIAGLALLNGLALVADIAGRRIADDLSNVKWFKRKGSDGINVTPVTVNAAETEKVTLNPPEEKPESIYEAVKQGIREAAGAEESPADIPFQQNGQNRSR